MRLRTAACIAAFSSFVAPTHAAGGGQRPHFESAVDVVAVDASVVDGTGRPVHDLAPEEFVVRVDGRPRRLLSLEFIDLGAALPVSSAGDASGRHQGTAAGRRIVIVVDRGQVSAGALRSATRGAARLLDQLSGEDRVAVFSLPSGPRLDFTSDRAALDIALDKIGPAQDRFPGGEFNISLAEALAVTERQPRASGVLTRECQAWERDGRSHEACVQRAEAEAARQVQEHQSSIRDRLAALEALFQALTRVPGPKVVVLISGGITSFASRAEPDVTQRLRRIAATAAAARVYLYSFYVSQRADAIDASQRLASQTLFEDQDMRRRGLDTLTGTSGGATFEIVAGAERAFERVASEASAYYLLALEPAESDRDGRPHAIDVKVMRKGVEIRARAQFVMGSGTAGPFRTRPDAPRPAEADAPRLRVATHVLRGASPAQVRMVVTAQMDGVTEARFGVRLLDAAGAVVGELADQVTSAAGGPVRYQEALLVAPGQYTLKTGAVDARGRRAVVDAEVNAGLVAGDGLDTSDLLLLEADGGSLRLPANGAIRGHTAGAYLEVYPRAGLSADLVVVSLEIAGREGTSVEGSSQRTGVMSVRQDAEKGLLFAEGSLDLRGLPPGAYVARAVVTVGTTIVAKVGRAFNLEGTGAATSR